MSPPVEIVITGVGVVSPIGLGRQQYGESLAARRSGIRIDDELRDSDLPIKCAGKVDGFEPKQYVKPRKSLKVMSRDIQLAYVAADQACAEADFQQGAYDPERLGVVFGADMIYCELDELAEAYRQCSVDGRFQFSRWGSQALANLNPLWMLKYLPNMPACHIGIHWDARGPNNSITLGEVSSLLAVSEAARVIERGQADVMIAGGTGRRTHPTSITSLARLQRRRQPRPPGQIMRPFDRDRDGTVYGEGAAAVLLERREHAAARGAAILAAVRGHGSAFEPPGAKGHTTGAALCQAIGRCLREADLAPGDLGHVNADGLGTPEADRAEAQAIRRTLGDVPVTAPKSFFGNLGAGTGAVELVASLVALRDGRVPVTLNYETPDPQCPVQVVHDTPLPAVKRTALLLNAATTGQAAALLLSAE